MHVGATQARTRLQERQRVHRAAHWEGRFDPAQQQDASTVPQVKDAGFLVVRCDGR
jgi:hypothetical protein